MTVAELAGTSVQPRVSTTDLTEEASIEPALLVSELTDGQPVDRMWAAAVRTRSAPGVPENTTAILTVAVLDPGADLAATAGRMTAAAEGAPSVADWVPAFDRADALAVLDDDVVLVLRVRDGGTAAQRTAAARVLAGELTAARRAALVTATDPATR